jgi:peptide/nickel transport system ATP-binding protein
MAELFEVKRLKKYFPTARGVVHAVDDVSFSIEEGKTMGLVGESGCGKSTLGRVIIHLLESTEGSIFFQGRDITHLNDREMREFREDVQIIFQDPSSSLNPRLTIKETIQEPLQLSKKFNPAEIEKETVRLMDLVGIEKRLRNSYPHELDGGRRQRVGIARALALNPKFVVCDEPVSALDVSIQAQILNLLMDLQEEFGLTYLFVTHNLSVVRHISNSICVMYLGQMVETCLTDELFENQLHPYSKALLSAVLSVDIHRKKNRILLKGEITSPINPKPGCRFAQRCLYADEDCRKPQNLEEVKPGHFVSCCKVKEINKL